MYYLIIIQNNNIPAIYAYENYDSALVVFHTELAWRGVDRTRTVVMIIDENGNTIVKDMWMRPEVVEE